MSWRERARQSALYLAAGLLCLVILVLHLRLTGLSLGIPFRYDDALISFVWMQNLLEKEWSVRPVRGTGGVRQVGRAVRADRAIALGTTPASPAL
jgi:hypothetical protein